MKCGIQFSDFDMAGGTKAIGPRLAEAVALADRVGFDSLWVMDHFWQVGAPPVETGPMLEGWTTLGFMAANSQRARLGVLVGGVHHRTAGLWVKAATTLDVLSGGRAWLGIGAGWNAAESEGLGIGFPPASQRLDMLEETLQIAHGMWEGERGSEAAFRGTYYQAARLLNVPQPISRPRVPIMIGGGGEKRTLRLAAKYADATNIGLGNAADVRLKYQVLAAHCSEIGRPFEEIERSTRQSIRLSVPQQPLLDWFADLAAAGAQHVILSPADAYDLGAIERFGREVLPQVHELVASDPRLPSPRPLDSPTGVDLREWLRSWQPEA